MPVATSFQMSVKKHNILVKNVAEGHKQTKIKVYCICRLPEFMDSQWIQCSTCKEWYHSDTCVNVSSDLYRYKIAMVLFQV